MPKAAAHGNKTSSISDFTPDVIGVCKLKFVYCPKCSTGRVASSWEQSNHSSWGVSLSCGQCNTVRMICKDCSNVNSYFCFGLQMFQHHQRKHVGAPHQRSKQSPSHVKKHCEEVNSGDAVDGNTSVIDGVKVDDVDVSDIAIPQEIKQSISLAEQPCEDINTSMLLIAMSSLVMLYKKMILVLLHYSWNLVVMLPIAFH
jgi:hypothetical protein